MTEADGAFTQRATDAFARFRAIDPATPAGAVAQRRLREADAHYRRALAFMRSRDPHAREEMQAGMAIAPLDPLHYRELGRIYAELGVSERAAKYYGKYLQAQPTAADANEVRAALDALGPLQPDPLDPPQPLASGVRTGVGAAVLLWVLPLTAAAWMGVRTLRPRLTLARLVIERPELDVAVAYLVASLRHEWLKHRIGAVHGLVAALEQGALNDTQQDFLRTRLLRQPQLASAFRAQLYAFRGTLDERLRLLHDPPFRRAASAVAVLERAAPKPSSAPQRRLRQLGAAYRELARFDAYLAALLHSLSRAQLSGALVEQAWAQVRSEYSAGAVSVTEFRCDPPANALFVRAFVADLLLALKNLLRNAVLALADETGERRLWVHTTSSLEPTGEELVHLHVCDTASAVLPARALLAPDLGSGLGLVAAAVTRYGGGMHVERAAAPYRKSIVLTLFRADDPLPSEGPP